MKALPLKAKIKIKIKLIEFEVRQDILERYICKIIENKTRLLVAREYTSILKKKRFD